jgi:hypothetical protein
VADLADRFFADETDEYVKGLLDIALSTSTSGTRYFEFNVFNVRLDFDAGVATIEDVLDPTRSESLSLVELRTRLGE